MIVPWDIGTMSKHILNAKQEILKQEILSEAASKYREDPEIFGDFCDTMEWRLLQIGAPISIEGYPGAFETGDITVGRKETKVTTMAWVYVYSTRVQRRFKIQVTNPITFLED
jgi:hypothetical protein